MGNLLLKVLMVEYAVIALVYAWQGNWAKMTYFIGAVIISIGVLWMR
jgi:hypothetical protein